MATMLRMPDEDRETYGITKEWLRFDAAELDDLDGVTLAEYESGLGGASFGVLFDFDKPRNTIRWQMAQVWLACRLAGFAVPDMFDFRIKIRKVERLEEPASSAEAGDADVPPAQSTSEPSSDGARSKKGSHK